LDSVLSTIDMSGKPAVAGGVRIVLAGQEKMGKTTLASGAPNVLLVPLEVGYAGVNVPKTKMLQTMAEYNYFLDETLYWASQGQFPFKSIAFDSATAMERHLHQSINERDTSWKPGAKKSITMESAHGGYGKAYNMANDEFDEVLAKLDVLAVTYGINIIFTCHVFSSKVMDPTAGEYDSWDLLLHSPKNQKTYGKRERITQWADVIGFLYEPMFVSEANNMAKAMSQGKGRVLGLERTPSYLAGNRFGIQGELSIPAPPKENGSGKDGWNVFAHALYTSRGIDVFNRQ
jgi:hypothetical protein